MKDPHGNHCLFQSIYTSFLIEDWKMGLYWSQTIFQFSIFNQQRCDETFCSKIKNKVKQNSSSLPDTLSRFKTKLRNSLIELNLPNEINFRFTEKMPTDPIYSSKNNFHLWCCYDFETSDICRIFCEGRTPL